MKSIQKTNNTIIILSYIFLHFSFPVYPQTGFYQKKISNYMAKGFIMYPDSNLLLYGYDNLNMDLKLLQITSQSGTFNWAESIQFPPMSNNCYALNSVCQVTNSRTILGSQEIWCYPPGGSLSYFTRVFEMDSLGNRIWEFTSPDIFHLVKAFRNYDSTFTIFAKIDDDINLGDLVIYKTDAHGNLLSGNRCGSFFEMNSVIKTKDNGYLGYSEGIFKLDSNLNPVFAYATGGMINAELLELSDSTFIVISNDYNYNYYVWHGNSHGAFLNGFKFIDPMKRVHVTASGSALLFGYSTFGYQSGIIKTDYQLNIRSNYSIVDSALHQNVEGLYVFNNNIYTILSGDQNSHAETWLIKSDTGFTTACYLDTALLNIGTYSITLVPIPFTFFPWGSSSSSTAVTTSSFAVPAWADSCLISDVTQTPESFFEISLFPNPAQNHISIHTGELTAITIYDLTGVILFSELAKSKDHIINTSSLANGMYFLSVTSGKHKTTIRFLKD